MSLLNLPEPVNWAKSDKRLVWVSLGFSVIPCYLIVLGILAATRGNYLTTVLLFGFSAFGVLLIAAVLLAVAGKTRARTSIDSTGFTVRPDRRFIAVILTGIAVTTPSALLLAILVPRGVIDVPMSRGMQVIYTPAMCTALFVIGISGLITIWRRGGVGHLKFTPAMVEIADARRTRVVEWDDIVDIKDHSETKEGKSGGRSVVLCLRDGSEKVIGGLNIYVPTGVALYWLVRHYWKHPQDRMELVDNRAAERFRDGHFDLT